MYILDFFIWKTNRMMLFCNLFTERPSYISQIYDLHIQHQKHGKVVKLFCLETDDLFVVTSLTDGCE